MVDKCNNTRDPQYALPKLRGKRESMQTQYDASELADMRLRPKPPGLKSSITTPTKHKPPPPRRTPTKKNNNEIEKYQLARKEYVYEKEVIVKGFEDYNKLIARAHQQLDDIDMFTNETEAIKVKTSTEAKEILQIVKLLRQDKFRLQEKLDVVRSTAREEREDFMEKSSQEKLLLQEEIGLLKQTVETQSKEIEQLNYVHQNQIAEIECLSTSLEEIAEKQDQNPSNQSVCQFLSTIKEGLNEIHPVSDIEEAAAGLNHFDINNIQDISGLIEVLSVAIDSYLKKESIQDRIADLDAQKNHLDASIVEAEKLKEQLLFLFTKMEVTINTSEAPAKGICKAVEGLFESLQHHTAELERVRESNINLLDEKDKLQSELQESIDSLQAKAQLDQEQIEALKSEVLQMRELLTSSEQRTSETALIARNQKVQLEKEHLQLDLERKKNTLSQERISRDMALLDLVSKSTDNVTRSIERFVTTVGPAAPPEEILLAVKELGKIKEFVAQTCSTFSLKNPPKSVTPSNTAATQLLPQSEIEKAVVNLRFIYEHQVEELRAQLLSYEAKHQEKYRQLLDFFAVCLAATPKDQQDQLSSLSLGQLRVQLAESSAEKDRLVLDVEQLERKNQNLILQQQETQKVMNQVIMSLQREVNEQQPQPVRPASIHTSRSPSKVKASSAAKVSNRDDFISDLKKETGQRGQPPSVPATASIPSADSSSEQGSSDISSAFTNIDSAANPIPSEVDMWYQGARCIGSSTFAISVYRSPDTQDISLSIEVFNSDTEQHQKLELAQTMLSSLLQQSGRSAAMLTNASKKNEVVQVLLSRLQEYDGEISLT